MPRFDLHLAFADPEFTNPEETPAMDAMPQAHDDRTAFERFLCIANGALDRVRSRFPYRGVIGALQAQLDGRPFVVIVGSASTGPRTELGCSFEDFLFRGLPSLPMRPAASWHVRRQHLLDVLEEPWRFLADPALIELVPFTLLGGSVLRRRGPDEARPVHRSTLAAVGNA